MADKDNILSIDSNDDDISYLSLAKHLEDDVERKKKRIALEIEERGDVYLEEIDRKKKIKKLKQAKLIPYILKHHNDSYSEDELMSYSYNDVKEIYDEIKKNRSWFLKVFKFLLNLE